ncbi:MAG: SMP-30/gluconolactonase/LRE family protein [Bacteroidota bacterium]
MKKYRIAFHVFPLLLLLNSCAIQPLAWKPQPKPAFENTFALNEKLTRAEKINLLGYYGAEEFAVDTEGNLYCGVHRSESDFSSGAILKISPENKVEVFMETEKWVTGLQFDAKGQLIALMNGRGLVRIHADKTIETLLSHTPDGRPIKMGTGLKIASDGKIYFANMSTTHETDMKYVNRLILEMRPTGGLYCFDPATGLTTTLSEGNYFGNGIALSEDESFLLLTETSRYRVLRYWLKGEKRGTSEVFMDNLPGFPNNIVRRENGNFWIGFTTKRNDQLDKVHDKPGMKKFVYGLPSFLQPKPERFGMVMEIDPMGEVVRALYDPQGETVAEAGAILEWKGHLYLGGDVVSYVSRVKLDTEKEEMLESSMK